MSGYSLWKMYMISFQNSINKKTFHTLQTTVLKRNYGFVKCPHSFQNVGGPNWNIKFPTNHCERQFKEVNV